MTDREDEALSLRRSILVHQTDWTMSWGGDGQYLIFCRSPASPHTIINQSAVQDVNGVVVDDEGGI